MTTKAELRALAAQIEALRPAEPEHIVLVIEMECDENEPEREELVHEGDVDIVHRFTHASTPDDEAA